MGTMGALENEAVAFLNFCRIEKGLAANSLQAYRTDLKRFVQFAGRECAGAIPDVEGVRRYMDSLAKLG